MAVFKRELKARTKGEDVVELQLLLAGFGGTIWDGEFGPQTKKQVVSFQRDYMNIANPNGVVDNDTFLAIKKFVDENSFDIELIKCNCGECRGFGNGKNYGKYLDGKPEIEAYNMKEYPGIHKAVIYTYMAVRFYSLKNGMGEPVVTSGYRCWVDNKKHNRTSTNHMGKAIDFNIAGSNDNKETCDKLRNIAISNSNCQTGWGQPNKKSLEPASIAPTWVHLDIRSFDKKFLVDKFFVKGIDNIEIKLIEEKEEINVPIDNKPFKPKAYDPSQGGLNIINDIKQTKGNLLNVIIHFFKRFFKK